MFPFPEVFVKLDLRDYAEILPESKRNGKPGREGVNKCKLLIQMNATQMGNEPVIPR